MGVYDLLYGGVGVVAVVCGRERRSGALFLLLVDKELASVYQVSSLLLIFQEFAWEAPFHEFLGELVHALSGILLGRAQLLDPQELPIGNILYLVRRVV